MSNTMRGRLAFVLLSGTLLVTLSGCWGAVASHESGEPWPRANKQVQCGMQGQTPEFCTVFSGVALAEDNTPSKTITVQAQNPSSGAWANIATGVTATSVSLPITQFCNPGAGLHYRNFTISVPNSVLSSYVSPSTSRIRLRFEIPTDSRPYYARVGVAGPDGGQICFLNNVKNGQTCELATANCGNAGKITNVLELAHNP
jgi:hypothetical protein